MHVGLVIAIGFAVAFALTNGFHDASNAIATLVATRAATPGQAVALSAVFNMGGAVLLGTAVADTIGKIVTVPQAQMIPVVGAGLAGATAWNAITWWQGLPSASGHALVGGMVGAAVADGILSGSGGLGSVQWGGFDGWHPTGVIGVLVALLISPPLGFAVAFLLLRLLRLMSRRWTTRWIGPVRGSGWVAAAGLSFSHGGNDAREVDGRHRGPAAGLRADHHDVGAAVGESRYGRGPDRGHSVGRMAHRQDDRPSHLQPDTHRLHRQSGLVHGSHPRRLPHRNTGEHHPGGGLLGRRCRRRAAAVEARELADRARDGHRVADHDSGGRADGGRRTTRLESVMSRKGSRWFLPETPDVIGMLQEQAAITVNGMEAFTAWAGGDSARAADVRAAEHDCDEVRRKLVDAVSGAFTTPLPPEDLFQLSRDLDKVINGAKNTVRESEAMAFPPDQATADMAVLLAEGTQHLQTAFTSLDERRSKLAPPATEAADAAVKSQRNLERIYRQAAGDLLEVTDIRVVTARREFYRRISAISDDIVAVADRIWYSQVKES